MNTETQSLTDAFTVTVGDKVTDEPGFTSEHITRAVTIRHEPTGREHAATFTYNPTVGRYSDDDRKRMPVPYSTARMHRMVGPSVHDKELYERAPSTKSVPEGDVRFILRCIADDAACAENSPTFDDFCSELGFFPLESREDYRRAEDTHNGCLEALAFFRSCGVDVFDLLEDLSAKGVW